MRVLVAVNNRAEVPDIESILAPHAVTIVLRSDQAVEVARAGDLEVVICSMALAGGEGLDLCRTLRRSEGGGGLSILMIAPSDHPAEAFRALEAGADGYVFAPFSADGLRRAVDRVTARGLRAFQGASPDLQGSFLGEPFHLRPEDARPVSSCLESYEACLRWHSETHGVPEDEHAAATALALVRGGFDALQTEVAIVDERGCIVAANRSWERAAASRSDRWRTGGDYLDGLREMRAPEEVVRGVERVLHADGSCLTTEAVPFRGANPRFVDICANVFEYGSQLRVVVTQRDVTTNERRRRLLDARFHITQLLSAATTLDDVGEAVLSHLLTGTDFDVGELWLAVDDHVRRTHAVAGEPDEAIDQFLRESRTFESGEGLPGRALHEDGAVWCEEVADDRSFARRLQAERAGIRTSVAVKMTAEGQTAAVIQLHARSARSRDAFVVDALENLALQVAQFVERSVTRRDRDRRIRELAESEKKQREQARFLRAVLDSSADGIAIASPDGDVVLVSCSLEEIVGPVVATEPPSRWSETHGLFTPDGERLLATEELPLVRALAGETAMLEMTIRNEHRPEGVPVAVVAAPVIGDAGERLGAVASVRDLTAQKAAGAQIERKEEQLRHLQRLDELGHLAGGVAHDLNNLLTIIMTFGAFVSDELPDGSRAAEDMARVDDAVASAAALTKQLLAFSRHSAMELGLVDVNALVRKTVQMLRRVIGEHVVVHVELEPEVYDVVADVHCLEQVIVNLAVNARDAMLRGGRLTITTQNVTTEGDLEVRRGGTLPAGSYVSLGVSDDGEGIAAEHLSRIFDPFFTTKPEGHGSGLGLSTCLGIVEQVGGFLDVHSTRGQGTTFEVYLPRANVPAVRPAPQVGRASGAPTGRVLVVDRDEVARSAMARALSEAGFDVLEASHVEEALAIVEQDDAAPDVLVADALDVGGRDLVSALESRARVAVILTSGGEAVKPRAGRGPAVSSLPKPFAPAALIGVIHETLAALDSTDPDEDDSSP